MKSVFLYIIVVLLILTPVLYAAPGGGGYNGYRHLSALVTVEYPGGSPAAGVEVRMIAIMYGSEGDGSQIVYGNTTSGGWVNLSADVYYDGWEEGHFLNVSVSDDNYTVLSSSNTSSSVSYTLYPDFEVIFDRDKDSIDDNIEAQIANKFKPVLHKHSHDYQPGLQNFEYLLSNGVFTLYVYSDDGAQELHSSIINSSDISLHKWHIWHWDTYGFGSVSAGICYLDLTNSWRYTSAPVGQRPLYYHVYKDANYYYIQYWYYFAMDDKREMLVLEDETWHESDWEHVCIRLNENNGVFTPDKVNFYSHYGGRTYNANDCWWSSNILSTYTGIQQGYNESRPHLHIWIGANGHASYNRYANVYKIQGGAHYYQDRVDYSPANNDLYFDYDILVKFGEVSDGTFIKCPDSGKTLEYHRYPKGNGSIPWSAFVGRCGVNKNPWHWPAAHSPKMPSLESMYHDWVSFTIGTPSFGNDPWYDFMISWVVDGSIGD